MAGNILAGDVSTVEASQVPELKDMATFLDVREPRGMSGCIPGSLNIPLSELRTRLNEIPEANRWLSIAKWGEEHTLPAALRKLGLDVSNLAGGWRSYATVSSDC